MWQVLFLTTKTMTTFSKIYFLVLAGILLAFSACKKDPEGPNISVSPSEIHIETTPGALIEFAIDAFAGDNDLSSVVITSKPEGYITSTLLDTIVQGSSASFYYVYQVPSGWDDIVLSFVVTDSEGEDSRTSRRILIDGNEPLTESTGHYLYSRYASSQTTGFDFESNTPLVVSALSDSTMVHLFENDDTDDESLSYEWTSIAGNKFVRNNSFNYPEATAASAQSTYESSTAVQVITDLAIDDILITEYDTTNHYFAVMKIIDIQDNTGSENDRYVFNVKR